MKQETIDRIRKFTEDMIYSQNLLDKLELDVDGIVNMKMTMNEAKYPVEKAKGNATKYDQL